MFHFSTERLAGLDNMILKISAPSKLPTIISNHPLDHDPYIKLKKLKKAKPQRASRPPLADKTSFNNVALNPPPTETVINPMLLNVPCCPTSEVKVLTAKDATPPRVGRSPADTNSFRPLPPLPSASTLQLPSFLNFSTQSLTPPAEPQPRRSTSSLPASVLFRVSSTPVSSRRRVVIRKTKNKKVYEGPHWIPAFHHPNSPYVPWTSAARLRILPLPSPLSPPLSTSPVLPPFFSRSGAVAPEPWASDISSEIHKKSAKEKLSSSWKSFKNSVKNGVKNVVTHLGKSRKCLKKPYNSQDIPRTRDGTDTITAHKFNMTSIASPSLPLRPVSSCSLASFASSDSKTLSTWLAERRTTAPEVADDSAGEMSVEEYELMGSWLDLRHNDREWVCGVNGCDLHTSDGSPNVMCDHFKVFRTAMPFDSADLLVAPTQPREPSPSFSSEILAPLRFSSLPRLPSQSFNIVSACKEEPGVYPNAERCLTSKKSRELSMPGGWTFS
ncbi:hypothetical protein BDN67DRAFT_1008526 [Paxillus ammoniavirescens]|nr:hypothetical protein BDN67DRAFT_1008526 [Paxillus ammoniavirescens]